MTRRKHRLPMGAPMIQAIQREIEQPGTGKTMTRRIVKPQPDFVANYYEPGKATVPYKGGSIDAEIIKRPYGQPGDLLAFTETWCRFPRSAPDGMGENLYFRADQAVLDIAKVRMRQCGVKWTPARFMPYWASRYTGVVTDVRVERVQEISEADALAEGATGYEPMHGPGAPAESASDVLTARWAFANLWNSIHGSDAWARNDWVWVYTYRPIAANVLDVERDPAAYGLEGAA